MRSKLVAIVAIAITAGMTGAVARALPAQHDHEAQLRSADGARSLWTRQHLRDYRYRLRVRCSCPKSSRGPVTIVVRNGRPRGSRGFQRRLDTVPELFAEVTDALVSDLAGEIRVSYDRRRGFPTTGKINPNRISAGDEFSFTVDRFRVLR